MSEYKIPLDENSNFVVEKGNTYVSLTVERKCIHKRVPQEDCAYCVGTGWWTSQDEGTSIPLTHIESLIRVLKKIEFLTLLELGKAPNEASKP